MKCKLILILLVSFFSIGLSAQEEPKSEKSTYFGFSTGLNNSGGLIGFSLEQFVAQKLSVFGAAGIGSWGFKSGGGFRYYLNGKSGNGFGLSYTRASGLDNFEPDNVKILDNGTEKTVKGKFNFKPVQQINITWLRMWRIGKNSRMGIELGYSINISGEDNFTGELVPKLTDESRSTLNVAQPGGLIFGFTYNFGF